MKDICHGATLGKMIRSDGCLYERFMSNTHYTRVVDRKKLDFIFEAIMNYVDKSNTHLEDLSILEVGCEKGGITLPLTSMGCTIKAIDIDESSVDFLKKTIKEKNIENLVVEHRDAITLEEKDRYDIVIASEVFEHLIFPNQLSCKISGIAREGAYLIVTTPNGYGPWELKNRINPMMYIRRNNKIRKIFKKEPYIKGSGNNHCQYYTRKRLVEMFESDFFVLRKMSCSDSFITIFKALSNNSLLSEIDVKMADMLPFWLASGWYFLFEKIADGPERL